MKKNILFLAFAAMTFTYSCAQKSQHKAKTTTTKVEAKVATKASYTVKTIPATVKGEDVVKTIAANYKGKVALIDFWATWCGPCRMAMKQIDDIKPELSKKGCVFVYITGETSPLNTWNDMIKGIDGDHYRLTDKQWQDMCKSLNIPGIPSYLLLGKDGEKAYDNLSTGGYPGSEILKNEIEVALTK